jgi:excinuclease ABC subunit C
VRSLAPLAALAHLRTVPSVSANAFDRKFGADFLRELPRTPAVYLFKGAQGEVLYAGKAKDVRRRLEGYRNATRRKAHRKMRALVRVASALEVRLVASERDALLAENELIRTLRPPYNVDGAYSFLYPAIGLGARDGCALLGFTTEPDAWRELALCWHGTFRSRRRALAAFDALAELLTFLAHPEPRSRLPRVPRRRGSRLLAFRQLEPALSGMLRALLAGESRAALAVISLRLVEKAAARRDAERVEELLRRLAAFYASDLVPLREALRAAGREGSFVQQAERDALFLAQRTLARQPRARRRRAAKARARPATARLPSVGSGTRVSTSSSAPNESN